MSLGSWQPLSLSNLETKCKGKRYDTWQQRPLVLGPTHRSAASGTESKGHPWVWPPQREGPVNATAPLRDEPLSAPTKVYLVSKSVSIS